MPTWVYEARDASGHVVRGEREASDRQAALELLRAQGLFLTRLEVRSNSSKSAAKATSAPTSPKLPSNGKNSPVVPMEPPREAAFSATAPLTKPGVGVSASPPSITKGNEASPPLDTVPRAYVGSDTTKAPMPVGATTAPPIVPQPFLQASNKDLSTFFGQMASLLHAGTSLGAALTSMSENATHPALRSASKQLATSTLAGGSMSKGMESFPGLFSPLATGIMSAGERGGFLERSFSRLARYAERDYELQQSVKRETWYPKLIVFCAILIPGVVPLVLEGFWAFLRQVAPPLAIIAMLFVGLRVWKYLLPAWGGAEVIRRPLDEAKLFLPIIGKVSRGLATSKFCRAMGALYAAGVSPSESVRLSAQGCGNLALAERAKSMIPRLEHGEQLTACMKEVGLFNPLALQMMRVGEESGELDEQLDKAADFLESDAETTIKQAVPVLGILVFLGVAVYVGSQIVQFWSGYFNGVMDMGENLAK